LVGVENGGECVIVVVELPALNECRYAGAGHGRWHANTGVLPARAGSQVESLSESLFTCGSVTTFVTANRAEAFEQLGRPASWRGAGRTAPVRVGRDRRAEVMSIGGGGVGLAALPAIRNRGRERSPTAGQPTI